MRFKRIHTFEHFFILTFMLLLFILLAATVSAREDCYSELWGKDGQKWSAKNRLPDFSYAGYQCGEKPIPDIVVTANVKDFGAVGDGLTDDTKAFNEAISQTLHGAILIPAGKYLITDFIVIDKPDIVLRGEGPEKTVLWFPKHLTDIKPNWGATTTGKRTSNYSWSGGYLVLQGKYIQTKLADIKQTANRGDLTISVSSVDQVAVDQWIRIQLNDDTEKTLTEWLYCGDSDNISSIKASNTSQVARITQIDQDHRTITVDRPLRFETRQEWKPELLSFRPSVTESGIENLTCQFPSVPWEGEFTELGYNGIQLSSVAHCWVRNIRMINAEGGIFVKGIHCTLSDISLTTDKISVVKNRYGAKESCYGHHGISVYGSDNMTTRFDLKMCYVHDLSVEGFLAAGNVFSQGRGNDLCFDHHKRAPYSNLFTQIDCGLGGRIWRHGGGENLGKPSAGWNTFWNITAVNDMSPPSNDFGPWSINVIGLKTKEMTTINNDGQWLEAIAPEKLIPENLYTAQLDRRQR